MSDKEKELEITWNWFKFHANQRFTAFYYYLIIIGALALGYLQCLDKNNCKITIIAPFLSAAAIWVSIAFLYLEIRNVELVNIGRKALRRDPLNFWPAMVDNADKEEKEYFEERRMALIDAIGKDKSGKPYKYIYESFIKHETWFRSIYLYVAIAALLAWFYSIFIIGWNLSAILIIILLFFISALTYCVSRIWKREKIIQ